MTTSVFLNNDRTMPLLGLGLYKATADDEAENAIISAAKNGYRLFDTASAYKNEESVGRGIARCGVPRKDLFKSGIMHSVLEMWTGLLREALTVLVLIISIFI